MEGRRKENRMTSSNNKDEEHEPKQKKTETDEECSLNCSKVEQRMKERTEQDIEWKRNGCGASRAAYLVHADIIYNIRESMQIFGIDLGERTCIDSVPTSSLRVVAGNELEVDEITEGMSRALKERRQMDLWEREREHNERYDSTSLHWSDLPDEIELFMKECERNQSGSEINPIEQAQALVRDQDNLNEVYIIQSEFAERYFPDIMAAEYFENPVEEDIEGTNLQLIGEQQRNYLNPQIEPAGVIHPDQSGPSTSGSTGPHPRAPKTCEICGHPAAFLCMGALVCRSCGARYPAVQKQVAMIQNCPRPGECMLMGWLCNKCFLQKCERLNMRPENNQVRWPCEVCDDNSPTSGIGLNYGVVSCRRCVQFFFRNSGNKVRLQWICYGNGRCRITPANDNCRKCHFEKCLFVGMRR